MKTTSLRDRKILLLISYIICISFFSCKKIDQLLTFTISNESVMTVNSTTPVNLPFNVPCPEVTTNSSEQFKNNNTSGKYVKDIRLKSLQLNITNPSSQTFAFLKSIHIYISTTSSNEIELASMDNISSTANTISLTATQAKLDDYIKAPTYSLRTSVVTRQVPTQNIDIKISSKFSVTANL